MTLVPSSYRLYSCNDFLYVCLCTDSLIDFSCYFLDICLHMNSLIYVYFYKSVYRQTFFYINVENRLVVMLLASQVLSNCVVVCCVVVLYLLVQIYNYFSIPRKE